LILLLSIPPIVLSFDLAQDALSDIQVLAQGSKELASNKTFQALPLDPAVYYSQLQNRKRSKKKNNRKKNNKNDLEGSFSGSGSDKSRNSLKYAFLKPETPPDGGQVETCRPPSAVSAFTFMNFALAAITIGANLVSPHPFLNLLTRARGGGG
jgi:hypothetical protein